MNKLIKRNGYLGIFLSRFFSPVFFNQKNLNPKNSQSFKKSEAGFTPHHFSLKKLVKNFKLNNQNNFISYSSINKSHAGFTLIELLVVVAIIALLSSLALIALVNARQKSRDVKRLSDMTQMNTALELFFTYNRGYPSSVAGVPQNMAPTFIASYPKAPVPGDGSCDIITHPSPVPPGTGSNTYYYVASGTPDSVTGVYPDYAYYFCLGNLTGNFPGGERIVTPKGMR
jgi:general secretion pathway protein G